MLGECQKVDWHCVMRIMDLRVYVSYIILLLSCFTDLWLSFTINNEESPILAASRKCWNGFLNGSTNEPLRLDKEDERVPSLGFHSGHRTVSWSNYGCSRISRPKRFSKRCGMVDPWYVLSVILSLLLLFVNPAWDPRETWNTKRVSEYTYYLLCRPSIFWCTDYNPNASNGSSAPA